MLAPETANAPAVAVAGSTGSSSSTVTVRPSGEALAESSAGPAVSGAKTLLRRPGVARLGSVEVAKLRADVLGPLGSLRSSDASVPPHDARYGTASRTVPSASSSVGVSASLLSVGKPAT